MQIDPVSSGLPARRATPLVRAEPTRVGAYRDPRIDPWRRPAQGGGDTGRVEGGHDDRLDAIDLDVLWEELDGLLGEAAATSGARRVSPLRPSRGDVIAAYQGATLGGSEPAALVDALA